MNTYFINNENQNLLLNRYNKPLKNIKQKNICILNAHGFLHVNTNKKVKFNVLPPNVTLFLLTPIGCEISNKYNNTSIEFFKDFEKIIKFIKKPCLSTIKQNHSLNHVNIIPPGSQYLNYIIDYVPKESSFQKKSRNIKISDFLENIESKTQFKRFSLDKLIDYLKMKEDHIYLFVNACRELFVQTPSNTLLKKHIRSQSKKRINRYTGYEYYTNQLYENENNGTIPININNNISYYSNERSLIKRYKIYEKQRSNRLKESLNCKILNPINSSTHKNNAKLNKKISKHVQNGITINNILNNLLNNLSNNNSTLFTGSTNLEKYFAQLKLNNN